MIRKIWKKVLCVTLAGVMAAGFMLAVPTIVMADTEAAPFCYLPPIPREDK